MVIKKRLHIIMLMFFISIFHANAIGFLVNHTGDSVICTQIINQRGNIEINNNDFVFTITIDGVPWSGDVLEIIGSDTIVCPTKKIYGGTYLIKDSIVQSIRGKLFYRTDYSIQVKNKLYSVEVFLEIPNMKAASTFKEGAGIVEFRQFKSHIRKRLMKRFGTLPYEYYWIGPWFKRVKTTQYARITNVVDVDKHGHYIH